MGQEMRSVARELWALLEPGVRALNFELVDVELGGSPANALLRVYIDSPRGVDVEDCARVSRQLSAILDVEDPIAGQYTLEVSSPGLDRPLAKREDYVRFQGAKVKIKTALPVQGRRNFTGRLAAVEGDQIMLDMDKERYALALDNIEKARLVPEW